MNIQTIVLFVLVTILLIMLGRLFKSLIKPIIIFEFERGLLYKKGKFIKILSPGFYLGFLFSTITKVDIRPGYVTIPGQEVLSSDGITLKASLAAQYEITDPDKAVNLNKSYEDSLYLTLQLALREIIGAQKIEDLLEKRSEIGKQIFENTSGAVAELGLKLISVNIKDIMLPGELKKIFSQVVSARQQGLAALEKAKGETAALRNLANAARMIQDNPALLQLRTIQSLGEQGNTLVFGVPSVVPVNNPGHHPFEKQK